MNESEVIERTEALPERFASRVPPEGLDGLRSMAGAGGRIDDHSSHPMDDTERG